MFFRKLRLAEPFNIGYPRTSQQSARYQELVTRLFPEIEAIEQGDVPRLIADKYIHRIPTKAHGYELYRQQARYKNSADFKRIWNMFSEKDRNHFSSPNPEIHKNNIRVWQGYEIVEHLRRTATDDAQSNPYPYSGLYPWEVLNDKVRHVVEESALEYDYFDEIAQSVKRLRGRIPSPNYFARLFHGRSLSELSPELQQHYIERAERERQFRSHTPARAPSSGWQLFIQQNGFPESETQGRTSSVLSAKWRGLSEQERASFINQHQGYIRTREYREALLDAKTSRILDYVYDVVGPKYDWRADKRALGLVYRDKLYLDVTIQRIGTRAFLVPGASS